MGAELFHADRRRDMMKLIIAFRNFANAPNKDLTEIHFSPHNRPESRRSIPPPLRLLRHPSPAPQPLIPPPPPPSLLPADPSSGLKHPGSEADHSPSTCFKV
jgi:hypothetical protein